MPHLDVTDCVLVVIDAQPDFYGTTRLDVDRVHFLAALERAAWVVGVGAALDVPMVVTEEDVATNGPTFAPLRAVAPHDTPVLAKQVFGADANPHIDDAVRRHRRPAVVLVGLETDVCVAHSAIGWREHGLRTIVVHDAVYSAGAGHANGLARLRAEGVEMLSAKELYYEWLRDLPSVRAFDAAHVHLATPPGFSL
ncbi:MAG: isochorismatase family protein [Acidimicrobiia bacterium]